MSFEASSPVGADVSLDADRARQAQRATWVSIAVNVVLTVFQIAVGLFAHAQSLVADGMHTLSDLVGDFMVMFASRHGANPADERHPYGHGRYETAASMVLGLILSGVGAGFLLTAAARMQSLDALPELHPAALWMALITLAGKEGLFRYMLAVAQRLRSPMLVANAWHARADAASSLVVAVGIGGSLLGYRFLEPLAAALVGFMILRMGVQLAWGALKELIDTGLEEAQVESIRKTLRTTPGVLGLHELRTRRMAHQALVDAHVQVDSRISVSEGHRIAELARARVLREHHDVLDVLVHIDPEDDVDPDAAAMRLPGRDVLLQELAPLLTELPVPQKINLHYLNGRVEVEVFLDDRFFADGASLRRAEAALAEQLGAHPKIRCLTLNCMVAPK